MDPSILFTGIKGPPPCWTEVIIMFALPIFTASHPATIVGARVLNFCVRDGERADCRLRREEGGERVAAVSEGRRRIAEDIRWVPQQETGGPTSNCTYIKEESGFLLTPLCWHYLFSRSVTRQLSSAHVCLTSVFGMGTGGPTRQSIRTY